MSFGAKYNKVMDSFVSSNDGSSRGSDLKGGEGADPLICVNRK